MKLLFWFLVILLVWWAYTRSRTANPGPSTAKAKDTSPQDMARCAHCGIHLPRDEAVRGEKGDYCSTEHRTAAQDRNPV